MNKFGFATLCSAFAIAGLAMSTAIAAQDVTPQDAANSPLYFANADKNHDGFIGRSEVPKQLNDLRTHFDQYDRNHDHRLSEAEYVSYLQTFGAGACRDDKHTNAKCQVSPYASDMQDAGFGHDAPAVSVPKSPAGQ